MRAIEFETTTATDQRTLYHTSPSKNRASILATGLEPRIQQYTSLERKPGIYMFETLPQAKEWAYWSAFTDMEPFDVWEIKIPRDHPLIKDKHEDMDVYNAVIGYQSIAPQRLRLVKTQGVPRSTRRSPKRPPQVPSDITEQVLTEGHNHPVIVVDVQPAYSGMMDGDENPVFPEIIEFVAKKQTGPVLMFVNAEDQGLTGDTVSGIKTYWEDTVHDLRGEIEEDTSINWNRFTIVDKGYGYFRAWSDAGIDPAVIIRVIRALYQAKVNDSRQLFGGDDSESYAGDMERLVGAGFEPWMLSDPIVVNWTSVAQLKRFSGAYIVGGGRNECLREVELLMNAFNIRYKRIDSLVYG